MSFRKAEGGKKKKKKKKVGGSSSKSVTSGEALIIRSIVLGKSAMEFKKTARRRDMATNIREGCAEGGEKKPTQTRSELRKTEIDSTVGGGGGDFLRNLSSSDQGKGI